MRIECSEVQNGREEDKGERMAETNVLSPFRTPARDCLLQLNGFATEGKSAGWVHGGDTHGRVSM